jgi:hypothetical protein
MKHEFMEFDHPHQTDEAAREILNDILVHPEVAKPKELSALGYPVRCIKKHGQYVASRDREFPLPEFLIASAKIGFTLGTEDDIPPLSVSKALKWLNICHKNPANISSGLRLSERMAQRHCSDLEKPMRPDVMNMVTWFFPDFIATTCWKPWIDISCVARSTMDGNTHPPELLIQMVSNWRKESRNAVDLITSIRGDT